MPELGAVGQRLADGERVVAASGGAGRGPAAARAAAAAGGSRGHRLGLGLAPGRGLGRRRRRSAAARSAPRAPPELARRRCPRRAPGWAAAADRAARPTAPSRPAGRSGPRASTARRWPPIPRSASSRRSGSGSRCAGPPAGMRRSRRRCRARPAPRPRRAAAAGAYRRTRRCAAGRLALEPPLRHHQVGAALDPSHEIGDGLRVVGEVGVHEDGRIPLGPVGELDRLPEQRLHRRRVAAPLVVAHHRERQHPGVAARAPPPWCRSSRRPGRGADTRAGKPRTPGGSSTAGAPPSGLRYSSECKRKS